VLDRARLLRAIAANHRAWFRRRAGVGGGRVERVGGLDVVVADGFGTIAFPSGRAAGLREELDDALALGLRAMSCWALREDRRLGTLLVARGFEWGWQPHWMARDLSAVPDDTGGHEVVPADGDVPNDLPYASAAPLPRAARRLVVLAGGRPVGHVVVNPWRGIAGIYDMGVADGWRRQGIGRALTLAACRLGHEMGCSHAVLNATGEGEPLYRRAGFESLGVGRTWWLHPGPRPTARQSALVEAIGFGNVDALAALDPTSAELEEPIPGGGPPLAVAVVTGRAEVADWILARRADLASAPVEPRGGTLLHVAVEWDDEAMLRVALAHRADPTVRDPMWNGTPLDWAEHLGRERLAEVLREPEGVTPRRRVPPD
jgi:ribosomal protein S18 acetylase RimI-like enzyme